MSLKRGWVSARRTSKAWTLLVGLLLFGAFGLSAAPTALAGSNAYCANVQRLSFQDCLGDRHTLTSNWVISVYVSYEVGAGALDSNFHYYGDYVYGWDNVCHHYGAGNLLYPLALNASPSTQYIYGIEFYGVDQYC